jgi:hypothetical protein
VKRKRISAERFEELRREAENHPHVRRLRELAEAAWEDLRARGEVTGPPPAPGEAAQVLREIVEKNEARRRGDAPRTA